MHQGGSLALSEVHLLPYQVHKREQGARSLWDTVVWPGSEL